MRGSTAGHGGRRFNERTGTPFNDLQYPTDLVLLAVLRRRRYKLSVRDVAELLLQRGCAVTHETIRDWEFRFAPLLANRLRAKRRGRAGVSWYIDESYLKVAERKPLRITTDTHPAYRKAIRWIVGRKVRYRCDQYLNNRWSKITEPSSSATPRCAGSGVPCRRRSSARPSMKCASISACRPGPVRRSRWRRSAGYSWSAGGP